MGKKDKTSLQPRLRIFVSNSSIGPAGVKNLNDDVVSISNTGRSSPDTTTCLTNHPSPSNTRSSKYPALR